MTNNRDNHKKSVIWMIGIPIIIVTVLSYFFVANYKPEYEELPYGEIIYTSKRYKVSEIAEWHKIDMGTFSIEIPNEFYFYLEQGRHGGRVGGLTNLRDTINFVHGHYFFDSCEGIVVGQAIGRCDTLEVLNLRSTRLVVTQTDTYINAYARDGDYQSVFIAWANKEINQEFLLSVFRTIQIK